MLERILDSILRSTRELGTSLLITIVLLKHLQDLLKLDIA